MPFCYSKHTKKDGRQNNRQRYKCHTCSKRFSSGSRHDPQALWEAYTSGKQIAQQLAQQCGCSRKTILRQLRKALVQNNYAVPSIVNIVMDTTYFDRSFE